MKKFAGIILFLTCFLFFSLQANAGGLYDLQPLIGMTQTTADDNFAPLAKILGQVLNSGLGNPLTTNGWLNVGVGFNMTHFDREGFTANSEYLYLPSPYVYAGASLFDIELFLRAGTTATKPVDGGANGFFWGGGAAYKIHVKNPVSFIPDWVIVPAFTYHGGQFDQLTNMMSLGLQVQNYLDFKEVQPYVQLGVSYSQYDTNYALMGSTAFYSYQSVLFHSTIGIRVLYLFYEFSFTPLQSHSFGLTFKF